MAEKHPGGSEDALHGSPETPDPDPTRWRALRNSGACGSRRDAAWTWRDGRAGASALCLFLLFFLLLLLHHRRCCHCCYFLKCKRLSAFETSSRIGPRQQRVFALIPSPQAGAHTKPRGRQEEGQAAHEGVHQGVHTTASLFSALPTHTYTHTHAHMHSECCLFSARTRVPRLHVSK